MRYPTYLYQFLIFLIIPKIECWPVFKQDPKILPIISSDHTHDVIDWMTINNLLPIKINCDFCGTEIILVEKRDISDKCQ